MLNQPLNSTLLHIISPTSVQAPFYHTNRPSILPFMSDKYLSLASPILAYWILSLLFHALDTLKLPYFEKYRLHESPEVLARNKVTMKEVVNAVVFQQAAETLLGLVWLEDTETILKREVHRDHIGEMAGLAPTVANMVVLLLGQRSGEQLLRTYGASLVRWVYWWGIPVAQMLFAL